MTLAESPRLIEKPKSLETHVTHELQMVLPEDINRLTQPRDEFNEEEILSLATSIASVGPINDPHIAFFDNEESLRKYVDTLNDRWKTKHTLASLKGTKLTDGRRGVLICIAGERRTLANLELKTNGCLVCQEKNGLAPCFNKHFPKSRGKFQIKMLTNPDYDIHAVPIQEDENFHISLKPGRFALSIYNRFTSWKLQNPKGTVSEFARKIAHRNPDTVNKALRYVDGVPDIIKGWVNSGKLKYGHALELLRMIEVGYDDLSLIEAADPALDSKKKMALGPFKRRIDSYVELKTRQADMLEIFREVETEEIKRNRLAKTTAYDTQIDLTAAAQRIEVAEDLVAFGYVDAERSALVKRDNVTALRKLAKAEVKAVSTLNGAMRRATSQTIMEVAPQLIAATQPLLELMPEEK